MDEYALCNPAYSTAINYEIFLHLSNLLNDIFILTYHMSLYLAICWSSWLLLVNSTIVLLEIWSWVYQVYPVISSKSRNWAVKISHFCFGAKVLMFWGDKGRVQKKNSGIFQIWSDPPTLVIMENLEKK